MDNTQRKLAIQRLDDYLTYLGCADTDLNRFSGAYLMVHDDVASSTEKLTCCYIDAKPSDLNHHWKLAAITDPKMEGDKFALFRSETLHWSRWRPFRDKFTNVDVDSLDAIANYEFSGLNSNGILHRSTSLYVSSRHDRLRIHDPNETFMDDRKISYAGDPVVLRSMQVLIGTAFMSGSFWTARVSIQENTPAVSLITDPTGVKELWKLRDISAGKRRRDALLHWVDDHWRVTRNDPDVEAYVRKQLRGSRVLSCSGLNVEINESTEDKIAIVKAKQDREAMKRKDKDRRKRLREIQGK